MMYDLIEIKPKINKKKVILVSIIAVLVILVFVFAGIKAVQYQKQNPKQKDTTILADTSKKMRHTPKVSMIPNYTQTGRALFKNIYHSQEKTVYLTFDDGPSKSVTPLILDLLKQENIKATFFVLGSRAEKFPDLITREYQEGHYIANHGYSHVYSTIYTSPETVLQEYNQTKDIVANILQNGYDGHLFRFPGGLPGGKYKEIKKQAKDLLDANDIASIDWNALSQDAAGAKTKETLYQNIVDSVGQKNTVVILMHDAGDKILTYEVLPDVIAYLKEQGYQFKNFYDIMK